LTLLGRVPTLDILKTTGTQHFTFPMRVNAAPFDNYDLRMALKYAIKRQELVDKILLGNGEAGNDVPVNASMPYFNTELPVHEFDPEKAAEHYKKSGHSGAIQLSVSDAAFTGAVDAAQLIAASAKEAGIEIELVREPSDGYWSNVWNKKPWCACYWGGRPTQDWMYSAAYTCRYRMERHRLEKRRVRRQVQRVGGHGAVGNRRSQAQGAVLGSAAAAAG
jgi:peptide/nickel transport system substrate-binding protein